MAKEWILNQATNRWNLNYKYNVGPVSQWIRECSPKSKKEWEKFYFEKLQEKLREEGKDIDSETFIYGLGEKLFVKITEVIQSEIDEVTEKDCIEYVRNLVISRTYDGYQTEKETIYGQLEKELSLAIEPAPDEWDRSYNVDFFIEVGKSHIGLQIKPLSFEHAPERHKWEKLYQESHEKFEEKYGGKVFMVYSIKDGGKKKIFNQEVVEEIKSEISRLQD